MKLHSKSIFLTTKQQSFFLSQKQCLESAHTERRIRIHVSIKLLIGTTKPGVKKYDTGNHKYLLQNFQPIPISHSYRNSKNYRTPQNLLYWYRYHFTKNSYVGFPAVILLGTCVHVLFLPLFNPTGLKSFMRIRLQNTA